MAGETVGPGRAMASRLVLAMVAYFALAFGAAAAGQRLMPGLRPDDAVRVVLVGVFLVGAALVFTVSVGARTWLAKQGGLATTQWRWLVLAAVVGAVFQVVAFQLAGYDASRIQGWRVDPHFILGSLLLSAGLVSLVEETFFRGLAIGDSRGWPAAIAVLGSAAVFSLIHPDRWLSVFVFSLVASALYLRAGLFAAHAFHFAYNLANYATLAWLSAARAG